MKIKKPKMTYILYGVLALIVVLLVIFGWKIYKNGIPTKIKSVADGDTIILANVKKVSLLGVIVTKGSEKNRLTKQFLEVLLDGRNIWLEYKNNLARVWVGCESTPKFLFFYGKENKPLGCKKGVLVNELAAKINSEGI